MRILLRGASVFQGGGFFLKDVAVSGGRIAGVGTGISSSGFDHVFDLSDKFIVPGLADVHVHLREPGFSYKATIKRETAAAASAGYTLVCPMPNLSPAPDSVENLRAELDIIGRDSAIAASPYCCITVGENGEHLADIAALAPFAAGFSDDGRGVQDGGLMREAMLRVREAGSLIAAHCEDMELRAGGYLHAGRYAALHGHPGICSESEWGPIERDLKLVAETGCRYHVCHVSAKESVELIRAAKAGGLPVTCETAPHYLTLCEDDLRDDGCFKMNPPLRGAADRDALVEGLLDGTIDVVATDHAPHSAEEKSGGLRGSLMGIPGLETAFPVLYSALVEGGLLTFARLVELMSTEPRRVLGLPRPGIAPGAPADLAVLDIGEPYAIDTQNFISSCKSSPFAGRRVRGSCVLTLCGGRIVYQKGVQDAQGSQV